ncbi:PDR/VanB family oxidoreductase [uncultured Corynebacterium sp.]|uniref:PDR/VanB family oxidoreductase n=1 Tax=uncultured Corynebacterium sp. TaxID=159447 RepID=UPI0025D18FB2|nr:PDR/VanB family oxidoreductase [uncultured Corynebacterium sp.]
MTSASNLRWQDAEVIAVTGVADRIRRITLRPEVAHRVSAGEHLKVMVDINGIQSLRSYSIVDATPEGNEMSLTVFHTPNSRGGSTYMHNLTPGQTIRVTGPQQDFPFRVGAPKYILVAGGIGITAIRGMAALLNRLGMDYEVHYAARSPEAMAYREEMIADHGDRLKLYFDSESVHLDIPGLISGIAPGTELYMCGPIRLMDAIRRAWREKELDPTNLRFETFGNSGWFIPERFRVTVPGLGVSTEIGENESLLEALEKVGVSMMSDCRRGECGLCQVKVLETQGQIDHRDVFFSDQQKKASDKLCACVSRLASPTASPSHDLSPVELFTPEHALISARKGRDIHLTIEVP